MEVIPINKYLEILPGTLEAVRREINLDKPGEMKEAVRILDEWVHQQNHFTKKDLDPAYLENSIVLSKGSIERAKLLIDKMCTLRTLMPKYFEPYDIREAYKLVKDSSFLIVAPKPTKEFYRVVIAKFIGKYGAPGILECIYKYIFSSIDYIKMNDYHSGVVLIYDISETDLKDVITNVNLFELRNVYMTLLESYGVRLKKIHLITSSKLVETLLSFFKQFLKKKIIDRIVIHGSTDELQQHISKDILPKDYGGTEKSLNELQDICLDELSSDAYKRYMKDMADAKVDESLRPTDQFNDLYAGTLGTFRTLTLD